MGSSLKDQLMRAGLAKEPIDPHAERSRKHSEEADERAQDETLPPVFDAPATGRIVEGPGTRRDTTPPPNSEDEAE